MQHFPFFVVGNLVGMAACICSAADSELPVCDPYRTSISSVSVVVMVSRLREVRAGRLTTRETRERGMIEMLPMINGNHHDNADDLPITKMTQQQLSSGLSSATSRRVRRNYLIMIAVAYALTLSCEGTRIWLSSPKIISCGNNSSLVIVSNNATTKTIISSSAETKHNYHGSSNNITETKIDNDDDLSSMIYKWERIHYLSLIKLTICTIVLIILFLNLQGSDPGYLTSDVMSRFNDASEEAMDSGDSQQTNITDKMNTKTMLDDVERQCFLEPLPQSPTKDVTLLLPPPSFHQTTATMLPCQVTTISNLYPQHTRRKSCHTCQHSPPLRSHHCNICNVCIATFDHHCKFLNTCIGERNHFRFWIFCVLNVICFHLALNIVRSSSSDHLSHIMTTTDTNDLSLVRMIIHFISRMYMYPLFFSVFLIWIIHTFLVLGNVTTFELTKGSEHIDYLYGTRMLDFPFGQGLCSNLRTFIMRDDIAVWVVRQCSKVKSMSSSAINETNVWVPMVWKMPISIDRESEDWWNHPWQNKYWSCC